MDAATRLSPGPTLDRASPSDFRTTMGRFATGVVVLTVGGSRIHGMTANAFSSVSLDPPLVLCCVARTALMHEAVTEMGHFAVSVLAAEQQGWAKHFADRRRPVGLAQFDSVDWHPAPLTGAPLLSGALAWLECSLVESYSAGDHTIFIGQVDRAGTSPESTGLLFFDGAFQRTAS